MPKFIQLTLLSCLLPLFALAQTASNIRVRVDAAIKQMVIEYDLTDMQPADSLYILIETASGEVITPRNITGSVGKGLSSGANKVAYWDVVKDNARINESIQARVQFFRPAPVVLVAPIETPIPAVKKAPEVKPATPGSIVVQKKSPVPVIGYVLTAGLGIYSAVLASAISKDSQTYNSKEFVTTDAEKAQYDSMLSSLKSRNSTFTLVVGTAIVTGVATTLYTLLRKPNQSRISLISPVTSRSTNLGVVINF